jgi:hypothetical protein
MKSVGCININILLVIKYFRESYHYRNLGNVYTDLFVLHFKYACESKMIPIKTSI